MTVRLRALVICVLAWAAAPALLGQQSSPTPPPRGGAIEGSVVDDSLTPLPGVTVTLNRSGKLAASQQTDASGSFRFPGLEPDTYQIDATIAAHRSASKRATLRSATSTLQVSFALARTSDAAPATAGGQAMAPAVTPTTQPPPDPAYTGASGSIAGIVRDRSGVVIPGVVVTVSGRALSQPLVRVTDTAGAYEFAVVPVGFCSVTFELNGFKKLVRANVSITSARRAAIDAALELGQMSQEMTVTAASPVVNTKQTNTGGSASGQQVGLSVYPSGSVQWNLEGGSITNLASTSAPRAGWNFDSFEPVYGPPRWPGPDTSSYAHVEPNTFKLTADDPVSTFGADVDTASYTNVRRFLNEGRLPPADAIRVEEFVNYFRFDYPAPVAGRPVSITSETGACPWAPGHRLVLVGARAQAVEPEGPRNLVFLLDVSGSMAPAPRLPLIKTAMQMFVDTLRPDDEVTIVTYAGSSGIALPPTSARHRDRIHDAIASLSAGDPPTAAPV